MKFTLHPGNPPLRLISDILRALVKPAANDGFVRMWPTNVRCVPEEIYLHDVGVWIYADGSMIRGDSRHDFAFYRPRWPWSKLLFYRINEARDRLAMTYERFPPADGFLEAIHERTLEGQWIAVQHHPDGDWSVAEHAMPWLPGGQVAVSVANRAEEIESLRDRFAKWQQGTGEDTDKLIRAAAGALAGPPAPPKTAAELCDVIRAWLALDCDWGDFEKSLDALVNPEDDAEPAA